MKIDKSNSVHISEKLTTTNKLSNLQIGSRLSVKIAEKLGNKAAILDMAGNRVRAEFPEGVPLSGKLTLILEKNIKGTFFFKIANGLEKENSFENMLKYIALNNIEFNKLKKDGLYEVQKSLREGDVSIFALNSYLLKLNSNRITKNDKIRNILNKLLSLGIKYENLIILITLINSNQNPAARQLYYILCQILPDKLKHSIDNAKKDDFFEVFDSLIKKVDELLSGKDKKEFISLLLNQFLKSGQINEYPSIGEILFFEGNKFKSAKYINNKENFLISLTLSNLGNLDIIFKKIKSNLIINLLCDTDVGVKSLEKNAKELKKRLNQLYNLNVSIFFNNSCKVIEKIIEIISSFDFNNHLDLKV